MVILSKSPYISGFAMKILLEIQVLRSPWSIQTFYRLFHQCRKTFAPLNLTDYEAIGRCEQEVPEYFNFASDVLDKWSQIEKVVFPTLRIQYFKWNYASIPKIHV